MTKRGMPQVTVRFTVDQIADMDRIVEESKGRLNRTDIVRQAIDEFLEDLKTKPLKPWFRSSRGSR